MCVLQNYHRQKNEIVAAEGRITRLRGHNGSLRTDNQRLQRLLKQANDLIRNLDAKMPAQGTTTTTTDTTTTTTSSSQLPSEEGETTTTARAATAPSSTEDDVDGRECDDDDYTSSMD